MSDCCNSTSDSDFNSETRSKTAKRSCPQCQHTCLSVTVKTMLQHIKQVWMFEFSDQQYFYCRDLACDVVYFDEDDRTINKSNIRTLIGIKEASDEALVCFCFGVNKAEAATNKNAKEFVIKQTKASVCSCATANPSGRCCLKDFPKWI